VTARSALLGALASLALLTEDDVRGASLFVSFDQPIETLVAGRDTIVARVTARVDELQRRRTRGR
jgi:hypothetical protein